MAYIGPTPQHIEEVCSEWIDALTGERDLHLYMQVLHLLVLNRLEQSINALMENLSESPELDRIATTLSAIGRNGLPIERVS